MEQIIEYIKRNYNPISIILYGSYANGTNNLNSDFDSLVISYDHEQFHDTSFVNGIQLDVFVYPVSYYHLIRRILKFYLLCQSRIQPFLYIPSDFVSWHLQNHCQFSIQELLCIGHIPFIYINRFLACQKSLFIPSV